jgi:hypothetical protein
MAQEETNRPEEEQTPETQGAGDPTEPVEGDEIDDGCGGNP